jgi:SAM-dependent methyltransferase
MTEPMSGRDTNRAAPSGRASLDLKTHWEQVYSSKAGDAMSWYQAHPTLSLELIDAQACAPDCAIIDIGGGDSTLVDFLVERHRGRTTVVDLSGTALARARARLGKRAEEVAWIEADVTRLELPTASFDVWHDRAVFHFLMDPADRERYVAIASNAVRANGTAIVATFAADGPTRCSGLEVMRYSPDALAQQFASAFTLRNGLTDIHRTPWGSEQRFSYVVLQRQ